MNMPLNFGQKVKEKTFDTDVIPKDTLVWMVVNVRGIQNSKKTNGRYLDIELTVAEGQPYAKRKIWDKIADPFDTQNSEEWRNMGYGAIRRILEAVKGASPDNPNSYVLNRLEDISGLTVPVLVGIEKGDKEYPDDKNRAEYLSPHSSVKKIVECFGLLQQGINKHGKDEKPNDGQGSLLSNGPAPTPAAMPPAQQPAPQAAPPAQNTAPGWLAGQPQQGQATPAAAPPQQQAPQGFTQGQQPAPVQQAAPPQPPAASATPGQPQPQPQTAPPPAQNATTSPTEQPASFPGTTQGNGQ